ncbi:shikimate kinase [Planococcus kocurii]|uniref:Shikimate kinase n=1 Tax=Planococcus kocurii TaxID=1374 RepID=A0ABN4JYM8_9BACL|nr:MULTISPECIES: shikimate kinase [Planococcus]ALS79920.1 shikimate kinase [Planococcus kocurii]KAA0957328.1 shikimate kinase [Planococcus sp. ANT_H30]
MRNFGLSIREKSIVCIGFMGVGKTTVGKLLAQKLYRSFVDIDEEIEKFYTMPIPKIFEIHGEQAFRAKEKELIVKYSQRPLNIISVGGGAFLQKEIQDICMANCIVLFLDISWESWKERIHILADNRPLLQGRSLEDIEMLFLERQRIYSLNHSKFQVDHFEAEEAADYLADALKLSWEINAPQPK